MTRKTEVQFNTREEAVSTDINRVQRIQNRESMNEIMDGARSDYHRSGTANAQSFTIQGSTLARLQRAPTYTPSGASFNTDVGEGEAYLVGVAAGDDPAYKVMRWNAATLLFNAPHAVLARIDQIYALGGELATDPQTRTILQDPLTQVTAPAVVNKLLNPLATLAIATGVANANPHLGRAAIPAGAIPLFDVIVTPASAFASDFLVTRVTERPHYEVMGTAHGLIEGITMRAEGPADETAGAVLIPDGDFGTSQGLIRAVVNGRLLTGFGGDLTEGYSGSNALRNIYQDVGAGNPFAAPDALKDVPYYFYLVPSLSVSGIQVPGLSASPFVLIESTVAPNDDGHPSAPITGPAAALFQADALYVGLGWKAMTTTFRKSFYWDADGWCWAGGSSANSFPNGLGMMFFNEIDVATGGRRTLPAIGFGTDFVLTTAPAVPHKGMGRRCKILFAFNDTVGDENIRIAQGIDTPPVRRLRSFIHGSPGTTIDEVDVPSLGIGADLSLHRIAGTGATAVWCVANAYRMNVNRLGGAH